MEVSERTARKQVEVQELRGSLDSVVAYLDLLLSEDMSARERRRFLEVIRGNVERARALIAHRDSRE